MATVTARPRVFVAQPIAASALDRLCTIAAVKMNPDSRKILGKTKMIAGVRQCDILVSLLHDKVDRAVLTANPKLRAVCSMAITPDNIDVEAATERGIPVTVVPPVVAEATADLHFALLLAVARRLVEGDKMVRAGKFPGSQSNHLAGASVYGKTIGLIGAGRIGQATARRACGFGMKIIYWAPRRKPEAEVETGMCYVALDRLLADADFISLHPPLNAETHHLISDAAFAKMKPSAFIINTARGPVIDEKALVRALKNKQIAGAGLDVFEHEPKLASALVAMKNVVLTPHLGSAVASLRESMAHVVVDNIIAILNDQRPPNCWNSEIYSTAKAARPARDYKRSSQ